MAARPIDGAEGYALFVRSDGEVSLDEINEYLRGLHLREVQPRMLKHYRKLYRHGYRSYITQNRLDLAVAGEAAWTEDMRAQYPELRETFEAELFDGTAVRPVRVESLGAVSASILDPSPPSAGASVVLRLLATGIERVGQVTRTDKQSGRFHLNFDAYSSLPVASEDSPFAARVVIDLPDEAESVVAISDVMLQLERSLTRIDPEGVEIVRISHLQMASPLLIEITGNDVVDLFAHVATAVTGLRLAWYQATKTKREAEGIDLENELKRRSLQREVDREIIEVLEAEESSDDTPTMDRLPITGLPKGEPGSISRRQFIETVRSVVALPVQLTVQTTRRPEPDAQGPVEGP